MMRNEKNRKVLVIDDDADISAMMCLVLRSEGFIVEVTIRSEDIFEKARSCKPDIILLDVFLTGYDGRKLCKQFKFHPETKHVPVILVSGHDSASNYMECGADDFILKPFKTDHLIAVINKHLFSSSVPLANINQAGSVGIQPTA